MDAATRLSQLHHAYSHQSLDCPVNSIMGMGI